MRYHFWYVLIHIGLGLLGFQYFTWSNTGGVYAALASAVVQAYGVFEIHRDARPRFEATLVNEPSHQERQNMEKEYRKRLTKAWFTRTCMYALLTLISAMAVRGGS
ncbi:MAG: hypothetical protein HOM58_21910 [Rhodospirillaceae bacterium]|jgi:hypothetical protein|nr:hypothetical protein [Rhodospirillaceae bacterium]MBT5455927.1 hypothetical protein [Rhodospirillaceae bacterium]